MRSRIFLLLFSAIVGLTAAGPAAAADRSRRVLIVESFGRDVAPLSRMILAFRAELRARWPEPIDLFEVSLESARSARPDDDGGLVNFLAERLAQDPVDLVVPFGTPAMRFIARHRDRLFPRAPILIAAVEKRLLLPELLGPRTVFVGPSWHVAWTVEDILQVLPGTREIVVVHGASPLEQFWVLQCQREFARFEDRVRFRWLNSMSFVAMKREVAALPRDAAVLYTMLLRDAAGVTFEQDQALLGLKAVWRRSLPDSRASSVLASWAAGSSPTDLWASMPPWWPPGSSTESTRQPSAPLHSRRGHRPSTGAS
jgi:hypothetical protein